MVQNVARSSLSLVPLAITVFLTALLGGLVTAVDGNEELLGPLMGLMVLVSLGIPFVVPVLWAWALLQSRPVTYVMAAGILWLVVGWIVLPASANWLLTTQVVTGMVVAWGLMSRWKPELIILIMVLISLPGVFRDLHTMPLEERFAEVKDEVLSSRRELLMEGTKEGDEPPSLEMDEKVFDDMLVVMDQMTPGSVFISQGIMSGLVFWLVWVMTRIVGLSHSFRPMNRFGHWRLPFGIIWVLAGSVGLMIVQPPIWPEAGVNVVLVVAGLLALQGAAVQWEMGKSAFPLLPRLVFMLVACLLFMPLVLLGLADQWADFRKLEIAESSDSDPSGS
ncbi:MAG: DUF2232 domain-containing protein [bacterium]|nr:DUF2232 domain-containing protein [bacterium]